jgi:membrane fusion protein (multidrug efflux system)
MKVFALLPGLLLASVFVLTGCRSTVSKVPQPPTTVTVVPTFFQRVEISTDLPGRTSPYRVAEIRPQVNGILLRRLFTEGGKVQAGQQLYQIDPAPYQAAYDTAHAMLDHARAELMSARLLMGRDKSLLSSHAVSTQDYDNALAAEREAEADVETGQAAVETARVNLLYTKVLSPISGVTGRSITDGALVTADQTSPLVTVQELDPIYVDIPESTAVLLRLKREFASGQIKATGKTQAQVTLTLEDGSPYDRPGQLQFSEVTVDQGTGSVIMRALFPNPDGLLLPGMFVTAHLSEGVMNHALVVPEQGITHDSRGVPTALVVNANNIVEQRVIKTFRAIGDKWVVTSGLHPGDRVMVEGLQKVKPGAVVRPEVVSEEQFENSTAGAQRPLDPSGRTVSTDVKT